MFRSKTCQVIFWSFLGPFFLFLTNFLSFYLKSFSFSYISFFGYFFASYFRSKGLIYSLVPLALVCLYDSFTSDRLYEVLSLFIAHSLSLIICVLSAEEIETSIVSIEKESESRLNSLVELHEKFSLMEKQQKLEKEELKLRIQRLQHELQTVELKRVAQGQLSEILQEVSAKFSSAKIS